MMKGKDGLDGVCEGVGVQIIESLDLFCVGILIGRSNVFFVLQVYQLFLICHGTLIRQDHITSCRGLTF